MLKIELNYRYRNKKGEWSPVYYGKFVCKTNDSLAAVDMLAQWFTQFRPLSRFEFKLIKPIEHTTYLSPYAYETNVDGFFDVTADGRSMRAVRRRNK